MTVNMPMSKKTLLIALRARLERCERDAAHAAIEWLKVFGMSDEAPLRMKALGELWRMSRLTSLEHEVMHKRAYDDFQYPSVYFLALDSCDPEQVPSFREWLAERKA